MRGYDYAQDGFYFVTICVKNQIECFGSVSDSRMNLNEFGKIVENCWHDLINHYWNCRLDEFIIMPNHVHGIVEINNFARNHMYEGAGLKPARTDPPARTDLVNNNEKCDRAKLFKYSLSEIIRGFKSFSSRRINEINQKNVFRWQRSFHDHIIRDEKSLWRIREYIKNNPSKWEVDRNNQKNLGL